MSDTLLIVVLVLILIPVFAFGVFGVYTLSWILPSLFAGGGPYVPTSPESVEVMVRLARLKPIDKVCDLGSGDGRIVIAAAQAGAGEAIGYEIDPRLIKLSQKNALAAGVPAHTAHFIRRSMWKADLHDVNVVFLYQISYAMTRLSKKLKDELPAGARIISSSFVLPGWEPVKEEGGVKVYVKKG